MEIKGIAKGDKNLRHFKFDDEKIVYKGGVPYYEVSYGKNPLEGEYGEDETGYVACDKVIPLGGKRPRTVLSQKTEEVVPVVPETPETPIKEVKTRGRKPKVSKVETTPETVHSASSETFEYSVEQYNTGDLKEFQDKLNKKGLAGWDVCGFNPYKSLFGDTHIVVIFKRKRG